jgi:DNA-binding NarL/FixJ family response regulator
VYAALRAERPHRPAYDAAQAAAMIVDEAKRGRLDGKAVEAVLAAAGRPVEKTPWPDGLTDREVDVLRLAARGATNKEIAVALSLSTKTVGNHLQNLYPKIGATTRAAAAMYAMKRGLLSA